jgi:hypothetical protein
MAGQNPNWQKAGFKNPPTPTVPVDMSTPERPVSGDQKRSSNIGSNARGGAPMRPAETDPKGYKRVG